MKKIKIKKKQFYIILLSVNIILSLLSLFMFDIYFLMFGYPELMFKNYETVKPYEIILLKRTIEKVEPFVQITIILILFFNVYVLKRILELKPFLNKYILIHLLNVVIVLISFFIILVGLFRIITSNGVLS